MKWFNLSKDISRKDAKEILRYMREIIDRYGFVTLADFYDLIGSEKAVYTDHKKGWRMLTRAKVSLIRRKGMYKIELPDFVDVS